MNDDAVYTHGHHESVLRSHRWRTATNSAAYLVPYLSPGLDLLDVGCGPGTITIDLAHLVMPGHVIGVDASASVIEVARAQPGALEAGVRFETGDAYVLDLADDSVDVVHAHQVLQHLADPIAALAEWRRVCRPGGVVAARDADYAMFAWYPQAPLLDRWLELYRAVARRNGGEPDAARRLVAWAHGAGFTEITPSASMWCFATEPSRAWWSETWAGRITSSAIAEQIVSAGLSDQDELQAIADGWHAWALDPDAWFAVPHGEIVCRA